MESDVLVTLGSRTGAESDELMALVRRLGEAGEPLEGLFNGAARAKFDSFKARTDEIAVTLDRALQGIVQSIQAQNVAFQTAATEGADTFGSAEGRANFDGADTSRFAPRA
jgi:uncharacterized protein YukE